MNFAKSILISLQHPVLVLDETLQPVFANPAFFKLFEMSSSDLSENIIPELIYGEICKPSLQKVIESDKTQDISNDGIEAECTLHTGIQLNLLINVTQIHEGSYPKMILVELRNITKEKEAELRIQELNVTLQKHVATVNAVNEELESYSHSVSHDLRTPLRFVSRIAHLLLLEPGTTLTDIATLRVNMILQATEEMGTLIENLLIFSQVNREPLKKNIVDLGKLFQEAVKELGNLNNNRNVEIEIEDLVPCHGDRTLLKEVASNLMSNALKFTGQREKVNIKIGCTESEDDTIYFIQDNGVGFNANDSESLFLPFFKLHKTSEFEGIGIGLALVKRIIERHGGKIWAESEEDKGAVFSFTLGK